MKKPRGPRKFFLRSRTGGAFPAHTADVAKVVTLPFSTQQVSLMAGVLRLFFSDRNPLHDVARDLLVPPVIEPGGARVGVACERYALAERVGNDGGAEGVGRTCRGREPSLRRRFIMWLMSLAWRALSVIWLVLLIAVRDSGVALDASCRPAASG